MNYDDLLTFMIRNINFDSHRWAKNVFSATPSGVHLRLLSFFLFCSHEWRAWPQHRNVIDYTEIKMKETNMNEFIAFRDHFNVSLSISFFFFFHFGITFPFFSSCARTRLFFITLLFNCYYQINACNTRKLWNFFNQKCFAVFDIRFNDRLGFH